MTIPPDQNKKSANQLNERELAELDYRRLWVARYLVAGLTYREIADEIAKPIIGRNGRKAIKNDELDQPVSVSTIARDVAAIRKQWEADFAQTLDEHKQRQLGELREAKRVCWVKGDMTNWRLLHREEMKLLGTHAPKELRHGGVGGGPIEIVEFHHQRRRTDLDELDADQT